MEPDDAVTILLGNPYDIETLAARFEAAEVLRAWFPRAMHEALQSDDDISTERLMLARGAVALDQAEDLEILGHAKRSKHIDHHQIEVTLRRLRAMTRQLSRMIGTSDAVRDVRRQVWHVCFGVDLYRTARLGKLIRDVNVLVLGETGTGKELVARAVMAGTPTAEGTAPNDGPPEIIHVAEYAEGVLESELFGHVEGAYTGAVGEKVGAIQRASGRSLFIDEVGDMPAPAQVKLLRVIQEDQVHRVGADEQIEVDVRYVAATHREVDRMASDGPFRRDLYHRLAGLVIRVPPLRDRASDVQSIAEQLLRDYEIEMLDYGAIASDVAKRTRGYDWPGNVRELEDVLRRTVLGLDAGMSAARVTSDDGVPQGLARCEWSEAQVVRWYTDRMVAEVGGSLARAARRLDVVPSTLYRRRKLEETSGG